MATFVIEQRGDQVACIVSVPAAEGVISGSTTLHVMTSEELVTDRLNHVHGLIQHLQSEGVALTEQQAAAASAWEASL